MADIRLNDQAYQDVRNTMEFLTNPRFDQRLSRVPISEVAMAMMYVAEELMVHSSQEEREKVAELAYQVGDQLGARIDDES